MKVITSIARFVKFKIVHIDDSAHRIAMGSALGLLVAWMPILGVHTAIVLAAAMLFRANKFAAVVCVWISNIFTIVPIYYPAFVLGRAVLGRFGSAEQMSQNQVVQTFADFLSIENIFTSFYKLDFYRQLGQLVGKIGAELWVGGLIIGLAAAIVGYVGFYYIIKWHREKYPHRRYAKHL